MKQQIQTYIRKTLLLFSLLLTGASTFAQNSEVEMADVMRSNGKIYVVVAVIAIIFTGIVIYLITLDRKVGKLEKELEEHKR
ncbi:MAG: CcmD family protein [Crocinitomicaceae bacterium]|nr:CcmD family protein [Crocinitomicaceae bacterium]|tara:strand:- start:503 stop:748 length:246 start_codon:yes stop_codon:yes gene_type:complete